MDLESPTLPNRIELLKALPHSGIGLELGVAGGWYSHHILLHTGLRCLYSVDPWLVAWPESKHYVSAVRSLAEFGDRSRVLKLSSAEAVRIFDNGALDFVYVDADHSHEAVAADIDAYWPKIAAGGVLSGHDYQLRDVGTAVDELAARESLPLHLTDCDQMHEGKALRSWWFIKR